MSTARSVRELNFGLVLTGGGARAAYQAGVMKAVGTILEPFCDKCPLRTITGISAGAINAAYLAARAARFKQAADECYQLWLNLKGESILKTDVMSLSRMAAQWMRDLSLGGVFKGNRTTFLLDTEPLRALVRDHVSFDAIHSNLADGTLHGVAFSATNYRTGTAVTFFEGHPSIVPWTRSSRIGKRARLEAGHVLGSASIPILFQPVRLDDSHYGDGSVRLRAPLSPAIHLGADRILAIGIRYYRPEDMTLEINARPTSAGASAIGDITVADIAGVMLNAAFMDSLEADVERMERINQTVGLLSEENRLKHPHQLRILPLLVIRPSQDLSRFASDQFERFPRMLRHLLKGIGASNERGWDLLSYLSFDRSYTEPLLELGYSDGMAQREKIEEFFLS